MIAGTNFVTLPFVGKLNVLAVQVAKIIVGHVVHSANLLFYLVSALEIAVFLPALAASFEHQIHSFTVKLALVFIGFFVDATNKNRLGAAVAGNFAGTLVFSSLPVTVKMTFVQVGVVILTTNFGFVLRTLAHTKFFAGILEDQADSSALKQAAVIIGYFVGAANEGDFSFTRANLIALSLVGQFNAFAVQMAKVGISDIVDAAHF